MPQDANRLVHWPPDGQALHAEWRRTVEAFWSEERGTRLLERMRGALNADAPIYPAEPFQALAGLTPEKVRVVVLGQDPYHGPGQAHGLAFSVRPGVAIPPSLRNIFTEIMRSTGIAPAHNGCLSRWAAQGVLLLNTCLTVEAGKPASHAGWGWEDLTDRLIAQVAKETRPLVFMLWGRHAQSKATIVHAAAPDGRHLLLQCNHPSPLSARREPAPFIGCGHFERANAQLLRTGQQPIAW